MARTPLLLLALLALVPATLVPRYARAANATLEVEFPSRVALGSFLRYYDETPPIEALPLYRFEARGPEIVFLQVRIPTIPDAGSSQSKITFEVAGPVAASVNLATGEVVSDPFDIVVRKFQGVTQLWQDTIAAVELTTGTVQRTCNSQSAMFTGTPLDPNGHVRLVAARCLMNFGDYQEAPWSLEVQGPVAVPVFPIGGDW